MNYLYIQRNNYVFTQRNNYFDLTNLYIFNEIMIYIINELMIYIFKEIYIYILNEIIIFIQRIIYIINEIIIFIKQITLNNIWSTKYKLGNWNLVFILCGFKREANEKPYICPSAIPMATKLGRVVTCSERTPPSKSRDLFITWSRDKFKKLISALPQYLWPPNLAEW